jgi:serine/threonine-protein kinase
MKATDEVNKLLNSEQIIIDPYTNDLLKIALTTQQNLTKSISQFLEISKKPFTYKEINILYYLLQTSIDNRKIDEGLFLTKNILQENLLEEEKIYFDSYCIHLFILNKQFQEAQKILESYPSQTLNNESLPLHYLYGCYIYITKNQDMAMEHFSEILDRVYPTTTTLLRQYVHKKIDDKNGFWFKQAFFWEKEELFRQLALFSFCKNDNKEEKYYLNRLKRISTSE